MAVTIDGERCTGCGECVEVCPVEGIKLTDGVAIVDEDTCVECGVCTDACPQEAITAAA